MKQAASFDDKANFVLIMDMLNAEFREHRIESHRIGLYIDDICCDVPALRF